MAAAVPGVELSWVGREEGHVCVWVDRLSLGDRYRAAVRLRELRMVLMMLSSLLLFLAALTYFLSFFFFFFTPT